MSKIRLYRLVVFLLLLSLSGTGCGLSRLSTRNADGMMNLTGRGVLDVVEQVTVPSDENADPIKRLKDKRKQEILKKFVDEGLESRVTEDAIKDLLAIQPFVMLTDDSESMSVKVLQEWDEVEFGPWVYDGQVVGTYIAASTDLGSFDRDLSAPGMFFGASTSLLEGTTPEKVLQAEEKRVKRIDKNCKTKTSVSYESVFMSGEYQPFDKCRNLPAHYYFVGLMQPPTNEFAVLLRINAPTEASYGVTMAILESVHVIDVPRDDHDHDH